MDDSGAGAAGIGDEPVEALDWEERTVRQRAAELDSSPPTTTVFGHSARDLLVPVTVGLFVLAFVPVTMFPSWTPRMVLLLALALPGVVLLGGQASERDAAAGMAIGFVAVAALSAVFSGAVRSSMIGFVGRDLSVLTVTAALGVWALARTVSSSGQVWSNVAFVASATGAAAVGILQVALDLQNGALALQEGRPMSFLVNPVYFGAICAAAAVAAVRMSAAGLTWSHVAAAITAAAAVLSGSRIAWFSLVVLVVGQVVWDRSRERRNGALAAASGLLAGLLVDQVVSGGSNSVDRATGGSAGRATVWRYSLESWTERPLLGHGVGLFRPAVQGRFTTDFVSASGLDDSRQPWFDAHNVVIGTLVATGVVGLVVLVSWVFFAIRRARGPAAWAAAAISITWLFQPVALATLPLALLLLGVAAPLSRSDDEVRARPPAMLMIPAVVVSAALAMTVAIADLRLKSTVDAASLENATSAAAWLPGDPVVANVVAQVAKIEGGLRPNARSVEWRQRSVAREPDRPYWWNLLAEEHLQLGDIDAAQGAVDEALRLQPTNYASNRLALDLAILRADRDEVERLLDLLCELDGIACDLDADGLLAGR